VISREIIYSVFHYNSYRYLREVIDIKFLPPFIAGVFAMIISQPFEVIRNRIMIKNTNIS